jgi:hypothetical protein
MVVPTHVSDLQKEFKKRLYHTQEKKNSRPAPHLLQLIHHSSFDLLKYAFGDFGETLGNFAKSLDLDHPDILNFFDGLFCDELETSKQFIEFLSLAQYGKDIGLVNIFPLLGNLFVKQNIDKNIFKKIDSLNYNKLCVRLINDPNKREQIRLAKRMQIIDLSGVYRKGEELWQAQPNDFKRFLRFDMAYTQELRRAQKKMQRYQELGCISLASEIEKSINLFRENMQQSYYGFNRITMTNAAIILAKSLKFTMICPNESHHHTFTLNNTGEISIKVSKSFFQNIDFNPTDVLNSDYLLDNINYTYEPKVYPYHQLKDLATKDVYETINLLENFPEANQKPIFDHFGVIVPSIQYNMNVIKDLNGDIRNFDSNTDASVFLDKMLISQKIIHPVLVGEKDGKCFFISYWS